MLIKIYAKKFDVLMHSFGVKVEGQHVHFQTVKVPFAVQSSGQATKTIVKIF